MNFCLIRNAAFILDYAGRRILTDPDFAPRHSRPSFTGKSPNPVIDLPLAPEQILDGVELVMVSHLHADHFDTVAQSVIPKDLPLLCQPGNEELIRGKGFQNVTPVADQLDWFGIHITRTDGHHGMGEVGGKMGRVSGFVLQASGEPTLYWAGDTILCDEVRDAITRFQPKIIVTHSSGAMWLNSANQRELIVMDARQTIEVCQLAPESIVIAVHMESLDHATVSRSELRAEAELADVSTLRLLIPSDGDQIQIMGQPGDI